MPVVKTEFITHVVMPAQAGIQRLLSHWVPANNMPG
jgi:hypothetical protein